jgi:hypothetical protein
MIEVASSCCTSDELNTPFTLKNSRRSSLTSAYATAWPDGPIPALNWVTPVLLIVVVPIPVPLPRYSSRLPPVMEKTVSAWTCEALNENTRRATVTQPALVCSFCVVPNVANNTAWPVVLLLPAPMAETPLLSTCVQLTLLHCHRSPL